MNRLRERINKHEKLCGTLVSLSDPALCEILGSIGYDYLWIDMEHTYMSCKEVLCHLNAAKSVGTPAIVRVPQHDLTATKKIMDMGPDGIVFPMVRSAKEAEELVAMTLYPPFGTRGFGPLRAIGYNADKSGEYVEQNNNGVCRFIQIEHADCVAELESIVQNPYIDGYIFGPNDLSASVGEIGCVFDDNTTALLNRAIDILRQNGKYVGLAGGHRPETIRQWASFDIDMLTVGADWNFIYDQGTRTFNDLHQYFLERK